VANRLSEGIFLFSPIQLRLKNLVIFELILAMNNYRGSKIMTFLIDINPFSIHDVKN